MKVHGHHIIDIVGHILGIIIIIGWNFYGDAIIFNEIASQVFGAFTLRNT